MNFFKRLICFILGHEFDKERYMEDVKSFQDKSIYTLMPKGEIKYHLNMIPKPHCSYCKRKI